MGGALFAPVANLLLFVLSSHFCGVKIVDQIPPMIDSRVDFFAIQGCSRPRFFGTASDWSTASTTSTFRGFSSSNKYVLIRRRKGSPKKRDNFRLFKQVVHTSCSHYFSSGSAILIA